MKLKERGVVSDAWTVVLGDSDPQSSFDVVKFFQCFPKITDKIKELRDKLNVRVISTTDPLMLATRTDPTKRQRQLILLQQKQRLQHLTL